MIRSSSESFSRKAPAFSTVPCVKVVLKAGKGKIKVDLKPVFIGFGAGSAFRVNHVALLTPRSGGSCLGTNSTLDITARLNHGTCNDGIGILGVGGVAAQ